MAGVNAALKILGKPPMILRRDQGYIGVLIDDLVTKGTNEPYRMMTSRTEYRLVQRQDNADQRLTPVGYEIGLVSKERYEGVLEKYRRVETELNRLEHTGAAPTPELEAFLAAKGENFPQSGAKLASLLRRPGISYDELAPFDPQRPDLPRLVTEQVEIRLKYDGYIQRQNRQIKEFQRMEHHALPADVDYSEIQSLRIEAWQKLNQIRPLNLGQASRISGVSPADLAALIFWLERRGK